MNTLIAQARANFRALPERTQFLVAVAAVIDVMLWVGLGVTLCALLA